MYQVIYKGVVLFRNSDKNKLIDALIDYVTKRGLTIDKKYRIFGKTIFTFYDANDYYIYTIIKEK